jgi:dipeptidyl aminopeptidase/acylaminoacyl peptidase
VKLLSLPCVFFAGCAFAQSPIDTESYLTPPKEIASYFDLPRHTQFTLSNLNSQRTWFARVKSRGQILLSDIGNPYENFGGLMLDTRANRARTMSYRTGVSILLTNASTFEEREIAAPAGQWVSAPSWSPDGSTLMFLAHNPDASTIYLHNVSQNKTWELTSVPLLATRVTPEWLGNSKGIVAVLVPGARGAEPKAAPVASQPKVQVTDPDSNRLRTYRTLLQNQTDRTRLEYFLTGQLAVIDITKGAIKTVGTPTMISSIDPSPTGDAFRVTTTQKPFSYLVPMSNFGSKEEIWDANGKSLVTLNESKLRNGETPPPAPGTTPTPPLPQARRQMAWAADGNGLVYIRTAATSVPATPIAGEDDDEQRGQGGGARGGAGQRGPQTVATKEELVRWVAPYGDKDVKVLYTSERGFPGLTFSPDGKSIFITESANGTTTQLMIPLDNPSAKKELWSWKPADAEKVPGSPVLTNNAFGVSTLDISSGTVLMRGTQTGQNAETNPPRPFLDSYNVASNKITRLWQCPENVYDTLDGILSNDGSRLLVNHQSPTEVPNDFLYEGGKQVRQITKNIDLSPDLTNAKRYRFQVTRADGFKFWVKVTLPEWYVQGVKLPALFWFYPSEFENQDAYSRQARVANKNLFPAQGGSPKTLLLRRGWAFVEPDCPIVGPRGRMNDFYINDLRNNLSATIDALEEKGYCDRNKLAIGGHSYGGFSTANAMVQTPFFKAGIAGAGNYNRTLTPLAFQSEQRTIFEAKDTYLEMSSILNAEKLSGALLMYAGMDDQNVGTDPVNTIRMFSVLESIGKPAALYMYPYEDHGQVARESLMDQWARWIAWLDKYVLGKK